MHNHRRGPKHHHHHHRAAATASGRGESHGPFTNHTELHSTGTKDDERGISSNENLACETDSRTRSQWVMPEATFVELEPKPETKDSTTAATKGRVHDVDRFAVYIDTGLLRQPLQEDRSHAIHSETIGSGVSSRPIIVFLHGAGSSFRTFTILSNWVRKHHLTQIGIDLRGHGNTDTKNEEDLSLQTLHNDVVRVLEAIHSRGIHDLHDGVILVGHSLGGCIANSIAAQQQIDRKGSHPAEDVGGFRSLSVPVSALVVLDVVETAAIASLPQTKKNLHLRPSHFRDITEAIDWHIQKGILQLPSSAYASVPSLFRATTDASGVSWRTDLLKSEEHWEGWFRQFSELFSNLDIPRCLIFSGQQRSMEHFDRDIIMGQMQGRFMVKGIPGAGHHLHEDCPDVCASTIMRFLQQAKLA
eukprot:gb/GECG01000977.1/.p1 GENE.gb/GECG01000977.1/~~gb/GECG01000977.1/.p1  ORF type:complete len:416 (+),score=41.20 gb/GECG01000977.1/:1-1248(+)